MSNTKSGGPAFPFPTLHGSDALEMVRDADNDCDKDGLRRIPEPARAKIDMALDGKP
jgi:hypothetical protein